MFDTWVRFNCRSVYATKSLSDPFAPFKCAHFHVQQKEQVTRKNLTSLFIHDIQTYLIICHVTSQVFSLLVFEALRKADDFFFMMQ